MPDIRMPDGTIIRNVPEGTTKAQLQAKLSVSQGGTSQGSGSMLMASNVSAAPRKAPVAPVSSRNRGTGSGLVDQTLSSVNEFLIGVPEGLYNAGAAVTDPLMGLVFGKDAVQGARDQRQQLVNNISNNFVSRPSPVARTIGQIAGATGAATPIKGTGVASRAVQGYIAGGGVHDTNADPLAAGAIGAVTNVALPPFARWALSKPAVDGARQLRSIPQFIADKGKQYAAPVAGRVAGVMDDAAEATLGAVKPRIGLDYVPLRPTMNTAGIQANTAQLSAQRAGMMGSTAKPTIAPTAARVAPAAANSDPLAPLSPKAQSRFDRFQRAGVSEPTTGMVMRDPRMWNFERETSKLRGTGDPLLAQMQRVEQQLVATGEKLTSGAVGREGTGEAVQKALAAKQDEMQRVTSALYKRVRDTQGEQRVGELVSFRTALENPDLIDNPAFQSIRQGVTARLERLGLAGPNMQRGNAVTVAQAEELRKFVGQLSKSDPTTRMVARDLINALDDDVVSTFGDDAFKQARESAKARFQEFSKTFPGKIADQGLFPEQLTRRILGDGVSLQQVRDLRGSMLTGTPEQIARGEVAWNALKKQALDDLVNDPAGRAITVDGKMNGSTLWKRYEKSTPKLRELLSVDEFAQLDDWVRASRDATVEVPFANVNNSNTSSAITNLIGDAVQGGKGSPNWMKDTAKTVAKQGAAFMAGGPTAMISLAVGENLLKQRAAAAEAQRLMQAVQLAQNPVQAAAAMQKLQATAAANPEISAVIQRWQDLAIQRPVASGVAAGLLGPEQ